MSPGHKKILNIIFIQRFRFRVLILFLSLMGAFFGLAIPYYQKSFSEHMNNQSLVVCVALSLVYLIFNQLTLFFGQNESIQAQKKLAETIYRHHLLLKDLFLMHLCIEQLLLILIILLVFSKFLQMLLVTECLLSALLLI